MKNLPIAQHVIDFHGNQIPTAIFENREVSVAMKPVVIGIGLDWSSQSSKLKKNSEKFNYGDIAIVANDGKQRVMGCLPLKKLNGWLFSINPEKVKKEIREKVIQYQEECFQVLHDYWHNGIAVKPSDPCKTFSEKADFYDQVKKSNGCYTFATTAKFLDLGRTTLLQILRDNKILSSKKSEWNMPYQQYVGDYFKVEPCTIGKGDQADASKQVFITPKGLMWLQKQLSKKEFKPKIDKREDEAFTRVYTNPKEYDNALEDIMEGVFADQIETNKNTAIPVHKVKICCGLKWDSAGDYCGFCGKSLKFADPKAKPMTVNEAKAILDETNELNEDSIKKLKKLLKK